MAIKIAISLTALSLIQIGMADVWDKKVVRLMSGKTDRRITFLSLTTAALPPDGSGVAWWLAWCGGGGSVRSMKPKPSFFLAYIATSASH
jgi:hypothetical protein